MAAAIETIFTQIDADSDKKLDVAELCHLDPASTADECPADVSNQIKSFIKYFDKDDDDKLDLPEFTFAVMYDEMATTAQQEAEHFMQEMDADKDEKISLEEGKSWVTSQGFPWDEESFLKSDIDGDKLVSMDELIKFIEADRAEIEAGRDDDAPGEGEDAEPDDAKIIDDAVSEKVAVEEMFEPKPDRRLFTHAHFKPLIQKFLATKGPSPPVLPVPVAGGLIMIPLLVAVFGCRRRLRPVSHTTVESGAE